MAMTLICKACGAENARDAASCWKCEATGEALRGKSTIPAAIWITATVIAVGALGAGVWWGMLREGAPYGGAPGVASAPSAPAQSATPAGAAADTRMVGEAILAADPIDGPFFVSVFQRRNAQAIARAESSILAEMATNMQRSLRTPDICRIALNPDGAPLAHSNLDARRIAAASNVSLIRAVASGRPISAERQPPSPEDVEAFNRDLQARVAERLWSAYQAGDMSSLPVEDQCTILAHYWGVIAGYPPEKAAQWTAAQMWSLASAQ
jgi:ribosomal protein L40E